ncbi:hypothetical protein HHK36_008018 [Tetracentron sinense]|uniref:Spermidine hydroxycinnamoyl transferase n=1 Tax=Tetracentron sinense TaxID=13715 RepID=A0A834ZIA7_TETSI|nr:hypothetical protein HHK36_008018 [Tetracentron sinense]
MLSLAERKQPQKEMVILKGSYTVKPAEATPNNRLRLSEFDQPKPFTHAPTVYFYRPIGNSVASAMDTMRDSLSRALVHFYSLAGRLYSIGGGRFELECNAMGALLFEAESEAKIDDLGDFRPTPEIRELIPHVDYSTPTHELPLLVVQLTRFRCGGVSIGMGISHIIVDGQSALHFFSEWARIARGEKLDTTPFLDRTVFLDQNPPGAPRFDHEEFSTPPLLLGRADEKEQRKMETTVAMLKLTKDQIEKLKKEANEGHCGRPYSRYEAVAGHMWRCACKARGHEGHQITKIRVAVDCRNRLQPPLPKGYFGNAALPTTPTSRAGDLVSKPLGYASSRIREAVEKMTEEYVRSALDFLRGQPDMSKLRTFHTLGCTQGAFFGNPNMEITSWMGLPIYGADFGWGKEFHMGPGSLGFDGKSFILHDPHVDGSFIVPLRLQVDFMDAFKKFLYEDI